jgi:hypothetical protein
LPPAEVVELSTVRNQSMPEKFGHLILGAGFVGTVLAEHLGSQFGKSWSAR